LSKTLPILPFLPSFQRFLYFLFLLLLLSTYSCKQRPKSISFYFWRTQLQLDSLERQTLKNNAVNTLYIRYFDLDFQPGDSLPAPVAPIDLGKDRIAQSIVPVIFIKNRVFERLDSLKLTILAQNTLNLVNSINLSKQIITHSIQFDCDWTETTKIAYFNFLRQYKRLANQPISATIRLHQIKYPLRNGIPPVDCGVLMYYNIGSISTANNNSIYESAIAARYITYLKTYPLDLDIALPIFSWSQQIRDGKILQLLNKMNFRHFENDSNFVLQKNKQFRVRHACFHGGYYFKENDLVKIEYVQEKELLDIIASVNDNSNHRIKNLLFYDLDSENLALYEKDIFRKIVDHTN
jgi:hypothetical protein